MKTIPSSLVLREAVLPRVLRRLGILLRHVESDHSECEDLHN